MTISSMIANLAKRRLFKNSTAIFYILFFLQVANLLLAHGAAADQAGKNGVTPLHVAAQYDQQAVATTLLEKGADAKVC